MSLTYTIIPEYGLVYVRYVGTARLAVQVSVDCVSEHINELLYTARLYMRDLTQIDAEWLSELAPGMFAAAGDAGAPPPRRRCPLPPTPAT